MAAPTVDELRAGLESLPQELYDMIFSNVVACDISTSSKTTLRRIDDGRKMPVQLQINRKIRANFSQIYYSNSAFLLASFGSLCAWNRTIPQSVRCYIKEVRCFYAQDVIGVFKNDSPTRNGRYFGSDAAAFKYFL